MDVTAFSGGGASSKTNTDENSTSEPRATRADMHREMASMVFVRRAVSTESSFAILVRVMLWTGSYPQAALPASGSARNEIVAGGSVSAPAVIGTPSSGGRSPLGVISR